MTAMDNYWRNYEACLARVKSEARTVDDLIRILNEHFDPSSGEAFFPDGADEDMCGTLLETPGWSMVRVHAAYHFVAQDVEGRRIEFVEGDVYRQ